MFYNIICNFGLSVISSVNFFGGIIFIYISETISKLFSANFYFESAAISDENEDFLKTV